jgi:phosphoribosylformylglycinamidine (FGAM) synthase-like enzyme
MAGDLIYLLGETNDELGASEYYKMLSKNNPQLIGSVVPSVDFKKNSKTYRALQKAIEKGLVASSISVASGGLGIALAKASIGGMLGCAVSVKGITGNASSIDAQLFSESQGRLLVTVAKKDQSVFEKIMSTVPYTKIGIVTALGDFVIKGNANEKVVDVTVDTLTKSYHAFSKKLL